MKFMAEKGMFTKGEIISLFVFPVLVTALPFIFAIIAHIISDITKSGSFCIGNICHDNISIGILSGLVLCAATCIWLCVIEFKEKSAGRIILSIILICIYIKITYTMYFFIEFARIWD